LRCFRDVVGDRAKENGVEGIAELVSGMSDEQYRQLAASYLDRIRSLSPQAARITDKMPPNYVYLGLIHLAMPKASIIHTVRDPVDTCISCFSKLFTDEQNHTYDLAELGRYYRHYQALMAHWRRVLPPGRILDVRYEDVVVDLERAARRIIAHCGLQWDTRCLAFHENERPVRTASAMQVRQPLYMNSVGRWRQYEAFLGPLLAELYPWHAPQ
jgi:Sulfotransferase family